MFINSAVHSNVGKLLVLSYKLRLGSDLFEIQIDYIKISNNFRRFILLTKGFILNAN